MLWYSFSFHSWGISKREVPIPANGDGTFKPANSPEFWKVEYTPQQIKGFVCPGTMRYTIPSTGARNYYEYDEVKKFGSKNPDDKANKYMGFHGNLCDNTNGWDWRWDQGTGGIKSDGEGEPFRDWNGGTRKGYVSGDRTEAAAVPLDLRTRARQL